MVLSNAGLELTAHLRDRATNLTQSVVSGAGAAGFDLFLNQLQNMCERLGWQVIDIKMDSHLKRFEVVFQAMRKKRIRQPIGRFR